MAQFVNAHVPFNGIAGERLCLVASDGSLVGGSTRTVRGGRWGTAFSTWLLKKGVFPWGYREVQCGLEKSCGILS